MVDTGTQKFWFDGLPADGLQNTNDIGTQKFWFDGLPEGYIYPSGISTNFMLLGIQ